ncbi:MAG: hypothetical protein JXQ99_05660 [Hyphomicrobiaceae bacterium]
MALIDEVKEICDRLAPHGWRDLFLAVTNGKLDIAADDLATELSKTIKQNDIDRGWPGFEDFAPDGKKGIEAGNAARSLLYHGYASPNVLLVPGDAMGPASLGSPISEFPTLAELDIIENYIFSLANKTLNQLKSAAARLLDVSASNVELAVAVYAIEYRPAGETPHQRFADLCLSRTGVARVGNASAAYIGRYRGFTPFAEGDLINTIRVLPCRYSTWIAARAPSTPNRFGPARASDDDERQFWVPVHKLFNGDDCIKGASIDLELSFRHQNRKIERLHKHLDDTGHPTGFSDADRQQSPFIIEHGLADFVSLQTGGSGQLNPVPQALASRASFDNANLTFNSPPMNGGGYYSAFSPTLGIDEPNVPVRPWPEYAHIRFEEQDDSVRYFGNAATAITKATAGNYRALNITDSTADGWIKSVVSGLSVSENLPAYSLVAAPDFYPGVNQRAVFEWWQNARDPEVLETLPEWHQNLVNSPDWELWRAEPRPLSDIPFAPNVRLSGAGFSAADNAVTAVITPLQRIDFRKSKLDTPSTLRHAVLPDAAAGVFAPGWDVSADITDDEELHFSSYGLGTPFPEDAKLCAALSTFWPAAAPDTTRSYIQVDFSAGSVSPLTDRENGAEAGFTPWDGVRGPRIISEDAEKTVVRYSSYPFADYTLNALEGRFSIAETQKVGFHEYTNRILATLRLYRVFKLRGSDKNKLHILSFRKIESDNSELKEAQDSVGVFLTGPVYRFEVFENFDELAAPSTHELDFSVPIMSKLLIGTNEHILRRDRIGDGSTQIGPWRLPDE